MAFLDLKLRVIFTLSELVFHQPLNFGILACLPVKAHRLWAVGVSWSSAPESLRLRRWKMGCQCGASRCCHKKILLIWQQTVIAFYLLCST